MKKIEVDECKEILTSILVSFAKFCEDNSINYSLGYGTLLGAIRHKGFIPWDDDIDIMMPREDYNKFRRLYKSDRYPFIDLSKDSHHPVPMGKVFDSNTYFYAYGKFRRKYGLYIDVFPIDNVPNKPCERERWIKILYLFITIERIKSYSFSYIMKSYHSWIKKTCYCILKLVVPSYYNARIIELLFVRYNKQKTDYVAVPALMAIIKCFRAKVFPRNLFSEYTDVYFENHRFKAIKKYDEYLRIMYNDYMQLPPEEERLGRHGILAFYK